MSIVEWRREKHGGGVGRETARMGRSVFIYVNNAGGDRWRSDRGAIAPETRDWKLETRGWTYKGDEGG